MEGTGVPGGDGGAGVPVGDGRTTNTVPVIVIVIVAGAVIDPVMVIVTVPDPVPEAEGWRDGV
jgi:hypothetical protein